MAVVETIFELRDKMSAGLDRISNSFHKTEQSANAARAMMDKAQGTVGDLKGTLLELGAAVGVSYGLKSLAQNMIDANKEIETTEKKLGGLLSGLYKFNEDPAKNFRAGMAESTKMIQAFDDAEGELGIDKSQLLQTAQRLAPAFAGANKSIKDTIEFTKTFSDVAQQLGQNAEMSSMYVMQMLQYGMVPRRSPLFNTIGVSREEMKKLKTEGQRFDYLMKKLKVFSTDEMRKVETFEERMNRVEIAVGNIYEDAGKPLFEDARSAAQDLLAALTRNDEQVKKVARDVSVKMGNGIKTASKGAEFVLDNFEALYEAAWGIGTAIAAWKIAPAIIGVVESIAGMLGLESIGAWLAGLAGGVIALAGAAGIAIGEGMVAIWKGTGVWDDVADFLSGGGLSEAQRRTRASEDLDATIRSKLASDLYKQFATANKETAIAGLREAYSRAGDAEWAQQAVIGVAKSLGLAPSAILAKAPEARGGLNINFNNNRFDIKQEFAEGFDPDRIAVAFTQDLVRLGEMKMQSAFSPVGSVR